MKHAGLVPSEILRLRELEQENAKLKKIVADLALDKEMLQGELWMAAIGPRPMAKIKRKL